MAATDIDIDQVLKGMEVINREKAEIKLLVQLLAPMLEDIVAMALFMRDKGTSAAEISAFDVFSTKLHGAELVLMAERAKKQRVVYKLTYVGPTFMVITCLLDAIRGEKVVISSEGLNGKDTGLCRDSLLPQFIQDIAARYPQKFMWKINEFLAAANRQK